MNKENKRKILIIISCILAVCGTLTAIFYPGAEINNTVGQVQNIVLEEIQAIDENIVVEDITENEEISSSEETIEDATIEDEQELEIEEVTEVETFELENEEAISYDGDRANSWDIELGEYKGLTYYSQIDSRWKNNLYTSVGNTTQTIGSSGCGPTCAAMVISSIKGTVTPPQIASLFVQNGYRSANNGTYWSAYREIADQFNIGYTETSDIQKAIDLLRNKNYIIVSCGNGLFTTGGHYIVLAGIEGNTLKIYDPYLYPGKFETSTRRGKVVVEGNTIYCSIDKFIRYANYKSFFCYQDTDHNESRFKSGRVLVNIPIAVAVDHGEKWLVDDRTSQFWIHKSVVFDYNKVYGLATIAYDGGNTDLVEIFDTQFWVSEKNMYDIPTQNEQPKIANTVGQNRKLRQASIIYSNSNLSGYKFNYRANTTIKILENVNNNIDKVRVVQTGREGYIKNNCYK